MTIVPGRPAGLLDAVLALSAVLVRARYRKNSQSIRIPKETEGVGAGGLGAATGFFAARSRRPAASLYAGSVAWMGAVPRHTGCLNGPQLNRAAPRTLGPYQDSRDEVETALRI